MSSFSHKVQSLFEITFFKDFCYVFIVIYLGVLIFRLLAQLFLSLIVLAWLSWHDCKCTGSVEQFSWLFLVLLKSYILAEMYSNFHFKKTILTSCSHLQHANHYIYFLSAAERKATAAALLCHHSQLLESELNKEESQTKALIHVFRVIVCNVLKLKSS